MKIKGLIFDFDGLICDTETPELHAWETLFSKFGLDFPFEEYQHTIGAVHDADAPFLFLEEKLTYKINREKVKNELNSLRNDLIDREPIRPGILEFLEGAKTLNIKIGLASSSPKDWIDYHLDRLSIRDYFYCIHTSNDVTKTKPDPELFTKTLKCMKLKPNEVIALEDSINGVSAAKKAGLFVAVLPNEVTQIYKFEDADLVIDVAKIISFKELIDFFENL